MERVAANGLRLLVIGNSHGHIDHVFDNAPLRRASNAPIAIHPDDAYRLSGQNSYGFDGGAQHGRSRAAGRVIS